MQRILADDNLVAAVVYLDDVTVVGRDFVSCWTHALRVIDRLTAAGMKLSPKKCFFLCLEITVLGHHLGAGILRPRTKQLDKLQSCHAPRNFKEL